MSHRGLLLVNLGTPKSPTPEDVGPYLKEFLMDENVIDIPAFIRWPLVNLVITPRRKFASAEAYQEIWTDRGSPLRFHSEDLANALQEQKHELVVRLAMRYGDPSIRSSLLELRNAGVQELSVLPLYPHYAMSSTYTVLDKVKKDLKFMGWEPKLRHLPCFYNHPAYIEVLARNFENVSKGYDWDYVLMSYHGLPKRHLTKLNSGCVQDKCCDQPSDRSPTCYRYQSYQTSKLLADRLKLDDDEFETSFQSRLGPGWVEPFTDVRLEELAKAGKKKLVVFSPSFVADCLESLEEIQIRGKESFIESGGEDLKLVPSLNSDPFWVSALAESYDDSKLWKSGL